MIVSKIETTIERGDIVIKLSKSNCLPSFTIYLDKDGWVEDFEWENMDGELFADFLEAGAKALRSLK